MLPHVKAHGAAVVALTIDEVGMARTAERKLEIARRIHDIAVQEYGLRPEDLIFDALTFVLSTGEEEWKRSSPRAHRIRPCAVCITVGPFRWRGAIQDQGIRAAERLALRINEGPSVPHDAIEGARCPVAVRRVPERRSDGKRLGVKEWIAGQDPDRQIDDLAVRAARLDEGEGERGRSGGI